MVVVDLKDEAVAVVGEEEEVVVDEEEEARIAVKEEEINTSIICLPFCERAKGMFRMWLINVDDFFVRWSPPGASPLSFVSL